MQKQRTDSELLEYVEENSTWEPTTGCRLWLRSVRPNGYGVIKFKNVQQGVHRAVWVALYGKIAQNLYVCHACDTPSCSNPRHLWLGTALENTQDRTRKGRGISKEKLSKNAIKQFSDFEERVRQSRVMGGRAFKDQNGIVYMTLNEAADKLGFKNAASAICAVLKGRKKSYKGHVFRYI